MPDPNEFFPKLHRLIVEVTLLILLLIGAYKVIRAEWPCSAPVKQEIVPQKAEPAQPTRVRV